MTDVFNDARLARDSLLAMLLATDKVYVKDFTVTTEFGKLVEVEITFLVNQRAYQRYEETSRSPQQLEPPTIEGTVNHDTKSLR